MNNLILTAILAAATASSQISISRVAAVPPDVAQKQDAFAQQLAPSAKVKIQTIATTMLSTGVAAQDETTLGTTVSGQVMSMFPDLPQQGQPIETMVFLVLTEMANQQQAELKTMTAEMQKISQQKSELRTRIAKAAAKEKAPARPPHIATVSVVAPAAMMAPPPLPSTASLAEMRQRYDDLSMMSDANQKRTQLLQDNLTKAFAMLSNTLRKLDATAAGIVSNLK